MARDPVCGVEVDTLRARAVALVGRRRVYFCSAAHKAEYLAEPARFDGAGGVPLAVDAGTSGRSGGSDKKSLGKGGGTARGASGPSGERRRDAIGAVDTSGGGSGRKPAAAAAGDEAVAPPAVEAVAARVETTDAQAGEAAAPVEDAIASAPKSRLPLVLILLLLLGGAVALVLWRRHHGG